MTVPLDIARRVALLQDVPPGQLLIHEIYRSLQGESTFAGLPCVFVRLSVCESRCVWCDTPHAFTQGTWMPLETVVERSLAYDCPLVEVTGGEPLLQPLVQPLMTRLADAGRIVLLETSGTQDVGPVDRRVHVIMDLKCPDSGESHRNRWANLDALKPTDQIKFVIASRRDWDWMLPLPPSLKPGCPAMRPARLPGMEGKKSSRRCAVCRCRPTRPGRATCRPA